MRKARRVGGDCGHAVVLAGRKRSADGCGTAREFSPPVWNCIEFNRMPGISDESSSANAVRTALARLANLVSRVWLAVGTAAGDREAARETRTIEIPHLRC